MPTDGLHGSDGTGDRYVTIRVRRRHVYAAAGLVIGFAAGVAAAYLFARSIAGGTAGSPPGLTAAAAPGAAPGRPPARTIGVKGRPFRGSEGAPVTIVEFTDYQCPFCRSYFATTLPRLMSTYGDRIRYVVRNYPMPSLHPNAVAAAEAAECASDQDRFWAYHDRLFAEEDLGEQALRRYAVELGLDEGAFAACLDSGEKLDAIRLDLAEAQANGVTGTPTFFINGRLLEGAQPWQVFEEAMDRALAEAGAR